MNKKKLNLSRTIRLYRKVKRYIFKNKPDNKEVFKNLYVKNCWGSDESVSGKGSTLKQTKHLRDELEVLIKLYHIKSMTDIPCGDFNWMKEVDLSGVDYMGADIVDELVEENRRKFSGRDKTTFAQLDITRDVIPKSDLVFVRDCFVHLSFKEIKKSIKNIKRSGSKYLLTTTFTDNRLNEDSEKGGWRPLNLQNSPINLPEPIYVINEKCTEGDGKYADKSMALWKIEDL